MRTARLVTTSWDDGDTLDPRVAELLRGRVHFPFIGRICKNRLEDILGNGIRIFCYPKGNLPPSQQDALLSECEATGR